MLREETSKPVIGILESAIVQAMLVGQRFGIVTTGVGYKYVHYTEVRNFLGATSERFAGLIAVGLGVVELREGDRQKIITNMKEGSKKIAEKGADVVILGCAGKKFDSLWWNRNPFITSKEWQEWKAWSKMVIRRPDIANPELWMVQNLGLQSFPGWWGYTTEKLEKTGMEFASSIFCYWWWNRCSYDTSIEV